MPIYYRAPDLVVSHRSIDVTITVRRAYALSELTDLHIVAPVRPGVTGPRLLGVSSLAGALVTVPVIGPMSQMLMLVVVGLQVAAACACLRVRSRPAWQLRAWYRGEPVRLYESGDRRTFDAVCRAVARAREYDADQRLE
ncbi:DUF6232 family protein [Actinoplanes sp. NPDC023936]|uniref:DUF6232 family protein n=1 Tax=Actinoplanes sp. NPDC023936 TaxID=3154910 RepID=UPI0033CC7C02